MPDAGADVTHPVGFGHHEPSIAAVVGSTDRYGTIFSSHIIKQAHRVEIIFVSPSYLALLAFAPFITPDPQLFHMIY